MELKQKKKKQLKFFLRAADKGDIESKIKYATMLYNGD